MVSALVRFAPSVVVTHLLDRSIDSDTRDPRFESSHRQSYLPITTGLGLRLLGYLLTVYRYLKYLKLGNGILPVRILKSSFEYASEKIRIEQDRKVGIVYKSCPKMISLEK